MRVIAIDVGGTKTAIALFEGRIIERETFPTPRSGEELVKELKERLKRYEFDVVSVATMGPLDLSEGKIVGNPHLSEKVVEIARPLMRFGKDVFIANDCQAGAWGEYRFGLRKENLVYVTLSTGVGLGAIIDGHLLIGKDGNAHEIGHIIVEPHLPFSCGCGGKGHLEAIIGGRYFPRVACAMFEDLCGKGPAEIIRDPRFREVYLRYLYIASVNAINLYDPEVLVFGGSISLKNPDLIEELKKKIMESEDLITKPPKITITSLGEDVVLYGAYALALDRPKHWIKKLRYLTSRSS